METYIIDCEEDIESLGRKQTAATKAKISKAVMGKNNPSWKGGVHQDYYRRITGAKKGDVVHHVDGDRSNGAKSNLRVIKKKDRWKHDKLHSRQDNFKR